MKKIDTFFLSGGGINCIAFLGVFKYLIENDIIDKDFKNIKNIVCVSGAAFFVLPLILGYSLEMSIKICLEFNYENLIDYNLFDINNLLEEYGFYSNDFFSNICSVIFKNKGLDENITMKELYEYTKTNYVLKVTNLTDYKIEYINHISHPDLSVITAIKMTTCIPFIFKAIKYNDKYYVDGGLCGNFPLEYNKQIKSKNYLGIHIKTKDKNKNINNLFDFFNRITMAPISPYDDINKKRKNRILLIFEESGVNLNKDKEYNIETICKGYQKTNEYFNDS
jgi:predicted acylesterase/phospholipase RssA